MQNIIPQGSAKAHGLADAYRKVGRKSHGLANAIPRGRRKTRGLANAIPRGRRKAHGLANAIPRGRRKSHGLADAKCFVIDLDGVVYTGERVIPDAPEKIAKMNEKGRVLFLTNNSTLSRASYVEKLGRLGIFTEEENVITSGYVAANYIKKRYRKPRVFVIGEEGLKDELRGRGIEMCSSKCNIVLAGLDRGLTYEKLSTALKLIQNGADFIATNTDNTLITENGLLPGAGAVVAAIAAACGKEPLVVGKPSKITAEVILEKAGVDASEILVIGDRLETDILMGKNAGMKTALVLTGYAKAKDVDAGKIRPDYVLESL